MTAAGAPGANLPHPLAAADPLARFHPLVAGWFRDRYGTPTEVQRRAWPAIARGEHLLATAPTGSGKTLAAFLWALDQLLSGALEGGRVRVLYVSPLKALNNDVERNLLTPLGELEATFAAAGVAAPPVRVATRSGDTPQSERQKVLRRPPEILITTPESLNILLTSQGGRRLLGGVRTVILDEIHAVAGSRRGTHLITAVDRLVLLAGEVQRLALSATVRPLDRVARFVGGYRLDGPASAPSYQPRPVTVLACASHKQLEVSVEAAVVAADPGEASAAAPPAADDRFWPALAAALRQRIHANRTTLVFTNSRRMAEKLTRFLNEGEEEDLAYSHHGSLSREIRLAVEERFKRGLLPALVATSSLELGIDIGDLDEVLLVQTPATIASAVQRVGRAGHAVGAVSRGRFYPTHGHDLLEAAVVAAGVLAQDIEPLQPVEAPLDVLAQVVLAMTVAESWQLDALYHRIRASDPYHRLPRRHFDLVVDMLAGRYAGTRVAELTPRLLVDRIDDTARAAKGVPRLLYSSGGTIPDRGYFQLRVEGSRAKLGELDEEFVWERSVGDRFVLGAQAWRITAVTHDDVLVAPASGGAGLAPFWRGEELDRPFHLMERLGRFLAWADAELAAASDPGPDEIAGPAFPALDARYPLTPGAERELWRFLQAQRAAAGGKLPHRHRLLAEWVRDPQSAHSEALLVLHTLWGGRVNRPFAMALAAAWQERHGTPIEVVHDDTAVMVRLPHSLAVEELLALVAPERLEELLQGKLPRSGFFGARFREAAGRALLLPRGDARRRVPLWLNRQRAKKLLGAVARFDDFPVVLEAWRTCLVEEMDLGTLRSLLGELARGEIAVRETVTSTPSPFAGGLSWRLTNRLMYQDDTPEGDASALRPDLVRELALAAELRPRIAADLAETLRRKLQRTFPGYAPAPGGELLEWVKERVALPWPEWRELLAASARDHGAAEAEVAAALEPLSDRLAALRPPTGGPLVVAVETLPRLLAALAIPLETAALAAAADPDLPLPPPAARALERLLGRRQRGEGDAEAEPERVAAELLAECLRFQGPVAADWPEALLGMPPPLAAAAVDRLLAEGLVVRDPIRVAAAEPELCHLESLERLLRMARAAARPELRALPLDHLPLFLAVHQGLAPQRDGIAGLEAALERLFGWCAPAAAWEGELLTARLAPYHTAWLDGVLQESDLSWVGCGRERVTFLPEGALDLLPPVDPEAAADLFPAASGRFTLADLARHGGLDTSALTERLWTAAWAGVASNDTMAALRRGVTSRFRPEPAAAEAASAPRAVAAAGVRPRRRAFQGWQASRAFVGAWYALPRPTTGGGPLEEEERNRERARLLLHRYGVVFRELLGREAPALQWGPLFRTLRLLELAGEVLAGHFFAGVPGPQFATPAAVRRLRAGMPEDLVWWLSALDPAAPCGLSLAALGDLPRRVPGNHLVYHGTRLVLRSQRGGRRLEVAVPPDHPRLGEYLEPLAVQLTRQFRPRRSIEVTTINGEAAAASPYAAALAARFHTTRGAGTLRLWRRYG
ncbi:MAG TPA: DEAD/DEAH box helicase [Thermoanaerobaculia bacterium]|nr:DEAD/DEAH box helicase [Thermoanaerobaculia bacterium]